MKNLFAYLLMLFPLVAIAQQTEGEIIFEEKMNLHMTLSGDMEQYLDMIPKHQSNFMSLSFKDDVSLYQTADEEEAGVVEASSSDGSMQFQFKMGTPENILYRNIAEGTKVQQTEFMGKMFLVSGEDKTFDWKMGSEQKEIQGFMCQKATFEDSTMSVEAWFTPQIPLAIGPGSYGQLPGMILEINIDQGTRIISATKVTFKEMPKGDFKKPSKGKSVSVAEFKGIQEEKMKEMKAQQGKGGAIMIMERH